MKAVKKWSSLATGLRQIPKRDLKRLEKLLLNSNSKIQFNGEVSSDGGYT